MDEVGSAELNANSATFLGSMPASADIIESEWAAYEAVFIKVHTKTDHVVGCALILKRI